MSAAGTIWINLKADTKDFIRGLAKAQRRVMRAVTVMSKGFNIIRKSVMSLRNAVVLLAGAYGMAKLASSFLEASKAAEGFQVRLTALLGGVREGNRLFSAMTEYATSVPFTYEEIMASATSLAGVMKGGVDEITKWMPMIGDLAAVSGLSIQDTTGQIIRMYSAGAGAADMFRERGILAMMGFTAGAKYSAKETQEIMFDFWNAAGSRIKGVTGELAKTWAGTMSMFGDAWFQFRLMVMDSGPFDALKAGAQEALKWILKMKDEGKLQEWATEVASQIIRGIGGIVEAIVWVKKAFHEVIIIWNKADAWINEKLLAKAQKDLAWANQHWQVGPGEMINPKQLAMMIDAADRVHEYTNALDKNNAAIASNTDLMDDWDDFAQTVIKRLLGMAEAGKKVKDVFDTKSGIGIGLGAWEPGGFNEASLSPLTSIDPVGLGIWEPVKEDFIKATEEVSALWQNTMEGLQNTVSGTLSSAFRGEFKSIKDVFKTLANTLADIYAQMLAKMAVETFGPKLMQSGGYGAIIGGVVVAASAAISLFTSSSEREAERMRRLAEQSAALQDRIDQLTLSPLTLQMKQLNDEYRRQASIAKDLGGNLELVNEARNAEIAAIRRTATEMYSSVRGNVESWIADKKTANFGADAWTWIAILLTAMHENLGEITAENQEESTDLLGKMYNVLISLDELNEQQLNESRKLISAYEKSIKTIDDLMFDLSEGGLSGAQSLAGWQSQYDTLRTAAMGGDADAIAEFTSFIPSWIEFTKNYGLNQATVIADVMEDLTEVRSVAQSAMDAQINAMGILTASIDNNSNVLMEFAERILNLVTGAEQSLDYDAWISGLSPLTATAGTSDQYDYNAIYSYLSGQLPSGLDQQTLADIQTFKTWFEAFPQYVKGESQTEYVEETLVDYYKNVPSLTIGGKPIVINLIVDGKQIATTVSNEQNKAPEDF